MSDSIDGDGGETGGISAAMYLMARGLSQVAEWGEMLRSKDLKVRLAQIEVEWQPVFYPSIVEGDANR